MFVPSESYSERAARANATVPSPLRRVVSEIAPASGITGSRRKSATGSSDAPSKVGPRWSKAPAATTYVEKVFPNVMFTSRWRRERNPEARIFSFGMTEGAILRPGKPSRSKCCYGKRRKHNIPGVFRTQNFVTGSFGNTQSRRFPLHFALGLDGEAVSPV